MQFIDEATITVHAGHGGSGGDVLIVADTNLNTLLELRFRPKWNAPHGENGSGRDRNGRGGEDLIIRVPVGTQIYDEDTGELVADLNQGGKQTVVARGGRGGLGNMNFATPWDQAPRRAQPGEPGESKHLRLSLKLL